MRAVLFVACVTGVGAVYAGCGPSTPQGRLVRDGFEAIRADDWGAMRELTETFATLEMRRQGLNVLKESGSFLATIKKEQQRELRQQFDAAVRTGLFDGADFVEVSADVRRDAMPTASGDPIPFEEYSVVVEQRGRKLDSRDEGVTFLVVEHGTLHRITGIRTPTLLAPGGEDR